MTEKELFRVRVALLQAYLADNNYDGILLSRMDNFAMATGGKRNYVWTAGDLGAASLFILKDGTTYYIGNNIEATRVPDEELAEFECGVRDFLWFEDSAAKLAAREFSGAFVSDDGSLGKNVNSELAYIRSLLTAEELEKYRQLGRRAADAMTAAINGIQRGMTEADIAAMLVAEGARRRCLVPVALVAADDRTARYRHPLPTAAPLTTGSFHEKTVENYVMVVGCFMKEGLVASVTRFKRVIDLPEDIHYRYDRICAVDALMQEATHPGNTLGDVFDVCRTAYADFGFPADEWHNHHQGGATGYAGRTCKGSPGEPFPVGDRGGAKRVKEITGMDVAFGQAYAWNPSGVGVKSEDTFILMPDGAREIVTTTPELPAVNLPYVLGRDTEVVKSGMAY